MIYIIGNNGLTFYLAAKLQDSGKDIRIMANKDENVHIETNGVNLKEEHNLSKKHYKFKTSFLIKEKPELVIISCDACRLNYYLTLLSGKTLKNTPVFFFPQVKEIDYIKDLLSNDLIRVYFDGYLNRNDQLITLYGRTPSIQICGNLKKHSLKQALGILEDTNLLFTVDENENQAFWNFFVPYAAGSIFSTYHGQNLSQLIHKVEYKDELKTLTDELIDLASKDLVYIPREETLTKLYSTPSNYTFPLFNSYKSGTKNDVALICGTLNDQIHKTSSNPPVLSKIIKKIYSSFA